MSDEDGPLPPDIVEWLKVRRRQLAPLCPRCGRRKIEVARTGWCGPCTLDHEAGEAGRLDEP